MEIEKLLKPKKSGRCVGNQKVLLGFLYNCKVRRALNRMKRDFSQWVVNIKVNFRLLLIILKIRV